ncbi:MAG TPA: hypothetical protein VF495_08525 [Phenylobacterium sp.]
MEPPARAPEPAPDPTWPVIAAYGAGVDSTAMLIELLARGERLDAVLFADVGAERPATYAFLDIFRNWLAALGVTVTVVRYQPRNFKNWPPYATIEENLLSNGTLPSIAFSGAGHTCSLKWKVAPQEAWTAAWAPAQAVWARGGRVVKLIGYDASPRDLKRYAHARTVQADERYHHRYPLLEWGWDRARCEAAILAAGLPLPPKSSCWFCTASRPEEIDALPAVILRRIVLMEARAKPRLRTIDGLWRKPVQGHRGATARPGSMTEYIRARGLLPSGEIDAIAALAPSALVRFREASRDAPDEAPPMAEWLDLFDAAAAAGLEGPGVGRLYGQLDQRRPPRGDTSADRDGISDGRRSCG